MNRELLIASSISIKEALRLLDKTALKVLLVVDPDDKLVGSLTDGDIRRAILRGDSLDATIEGVFNKTPDFLVMGDFSQEDVRTLFAARKVELIPVLNSVGSVCDIITWDSLFQDKRDEAFVGVPIGLPVVIMAGGKGTRMAPFTTVLPKPLIPIGDKTIIELIMNEFERYGISGFYITLNYRGEMIRAYMQSQSRKTSIDYVWEKEFLGTAGSLRLATDYLKDTFIVTNCDIIVKANYAEVVEFHKKTSSSLTIISSIQHHRVPYGVVDFKTGGEVYAIREKPEFTFSINTGVYILEHHCLDLIPEGKVYHMTHLIEALLQNGKRVSTYPVNEKDYMDIGQWDAYHDVIDRMKPLN